MPEFILEDEPAGYARIKVIGVGGGGCNAVDSMFDLGLQSVDFYVINTDLQALKRSKCQNRIQIGAELTRGRGCGADPSLGEKCMEEASDLIVETLQGADIVFVTAGLGGGTGTGAAPVVARIAREMGILTVSVVTKPFKFEGPRRMKSAMGGLEKIRESSDTVIVINNERLLEVVGPKIAMKEAFAYADKVLSQAVQSISDLVATPGLINVDFNDIATIMGGRGGAVMGVGLGKGESRASEAVKKATNSPLLDKVVVDGATGILICITGGTDMTLNDVSEATDLVAQVADPDAEIIFGAVVDESLEDSMRVTLIATGFSDELHRKRELAKAMESAPVARRREQAEEQPAPAPKVPALPEDALDAILEDSSPALKQQTEPVRYRRLQQEEEPVRESALQAAPAKPSLRDSLNRMLEEDEEKAPESQGADVVYEEAEQPAPRVRVKSKNEQPPIRIAPSRGGGNNGGEPRVRPARSSSHHEEARAESRRQEEAMAQVPQYSPSEESHKEEEDYDTPAFLRRRRSLFD